MLPPKVIMAPVDFSDPSGEALKVAVDFAASFGAQLYLVNVVPEIPELPSPSVIFHEGEYEDQLHQDAQKRLEQMAQKIAERGIKATPVVGTANDVSMELVRIAEHHKVDLLVIATHGTSGLHELAFGSVTEKVVRQSSCPVLVLKAQPAAVEVGAVEVEEKAGEAPAINRASVAASS